MTYPKKRNKYNTTTDSLTYLHILSLTTLPQSLVELWNKLFEFLYSSREGEGIDSTALLGPDTGSTADIANGLKLTYIRRENRGKSKNYTILRPVLVRSRYGVRLPVNTCHNTSADHLPSRPLFFQKLYHSKALMSYPYSMLRVLYANTATCIDDNDIRNYFFNCFTPGGNTIASMGVHEACLPALTVNVK
ncbi:hypothetical protein GQX74_003151 [Glossina fuscipes]|nr:hypothetical protein GQX74_003151 [Glossina fuscipes]